MKLSLTGRLFFYFFPRVLDKMIKALVLASQKNKHINQKLESSDWTRCEKGYKGLFKTKFGKWWGFCQKADNKNYRFYLFNPPKELRSHPHMGNFYYCGKNWYGVAFAKCPVGIEEGIRAIEGALRDAFEGKKPGHSQDVSISKRKDPSSKKISSEFKPRSGLKNKFMEVFHVST